MKIIISNEYNVYSTLCAKSDKNVSCRQENKITYCLAKFDNSLFSAGVFLETWVRFPPSVIILSEWNFWVILWYVRKELCMAL